LEIVSEPDMQSAEEVRAYAMTLRSILRYLEVNSGDMQKGIMRIEPNVSVRPKGSQEFRTRTEIKNLNSFRALERSVAYEIQRQSELLRLGERVVQQTLGWDESQGVTVIQRSKEEAHDYRYFPEPDLPPLVVEKEWIARIRAGLPELPADKRRRFMEQYGLNAYDAGVLVAEKAIADYYEQIVSSAPQAGPKMAANWLTGEFFSLLNQSGREIEDTLVEPQALAELIEMVAAEEINQNTAKTVLADMFVSGKQAEEIVSERGLRQISDNELIAGMVAQVLAENGQQVQEYLQGKENISRWLFGQVMRKAKGRANPQVIQQELARQLAELKASLS
jgi:aspartyl-tRNA(Asn)/glutamyl-tRNA(Gln) amidotransferase subunit B